MSRTERAVAAVDTGAALASAKAAVVALQRAFGRNRYILRTLPERGRIDRSRRLSGRHESPRDVRRDRSEPAVPAPARVSRRLLAALSDAASALRGQQSFRSDTFDRLAEDALAVDPSSAEWQRIAGSVLELRSRMDTGERALATATLEELFPLVVAEARKHAAPAVPVDAIDPALRSAWAAAGGCK